jgi:prepilin-type N-terminal cleavage/methylation domain-containing protein
MKTRAKAFTLVELLVVVGIIAILIAILLPALSAARRQAATVKCAAALKDIGNAFLMYVQDNKGYLPASSVQYSNYTIGNIIFNAPGSTDVQGVSINDVARWSNLIAKYVMKSDSGVIQTADQMNQQLTRSVVWGCPSFQGFVVASNQNSLKGDVNRNYLPYAVNRYPTMTSSWPDPLGSASFPTPNAQYTFEGSAKGTWYKLVQLKTPSERALMADARWSTLEARAPLSADQIPGQPLNQNQTPYVGSARGTTYDFYRHGKTPPVADASSFSPNGGKVAYNILYSDMHVATATDRETGYRAFRMRFPL